MFHYNDDTWRHLATDDTCFTAVEYSASSEYNYHLPYEKCRIDGTAGSTSRWSCSVPGNKYNVLFSL